MVWQQRQQTWLTDLGKVTFLPSASDVSSVKAAPEGAGAEPGGRKVSTNADNY